MIAKEIYLRDWMNLQGETKIDLPTRGYVLITGANGEGKSSFREAVAYARSGTTLRGDIPWRTKTPGAIKVVGFDGRGEPITFERGVEPSGKGWVRIDGEDQPTATKGEEALEKRLGSFDAWVRSSVFTGDALSSFVDATDTQRKQILESFLGVDKFDPALKLARQDGKILAERIAAKQSKLTRLESELDGIEGEIAELKSRSAESLDVSTINGTIAQLEEEIAAADETIADAVDRLPKLKESIKSLRDQIDQERVKESKATATIQSESRRLALIIRGECPTCESEISLESDVYRRIQATVTEQEAIEKEAREEIAALRSRIEKLTAVESRLTIDRENAESRRREYERNRSGLQAEKASAETAKSGIDEQLAKLAAALKAKDDEAQATDEAIVALKEQAEINSLAALALTPKGVRAFILTRSLVALERASNARLNRLFPGVRVKFLPARELANGKIVDEIDIQITGAADGRGYKALSTGQKKRVDFAILLAMATLARGAVGPSTLWFDEVLDGLDDAGVDAVCELVREIATEVPVVVISHREELVEKLSRGAEEWFHVEAAIPLPRSARAMDDGAKRFAPDGESNEQPKADKPNGRARRGGKGRAPKASAPTDDAPTPRARGRGRARARRSASAT